MNKVAFSNLVPIFQIFLIVYFLFHPTPAFAICPLAQSQTYSGYSGIPLTNDYDAVYSGDYQYGVFTSNTTGKVDAVEIYGNLDRNVSLGNKVLQCKLTTTDGTLLGESGTNSGPFSIGFSWMQVTFSSPVALTSGTSYRLYCKVNNVAGGGYIYWRRDASYDDKTYRIYTCANVTPNSPANLGPAGVISGTSTSDTTPSFSFILSDTNSTDEVGFQIVIDDSSDFLSPVVDFTSSLLSQGAATFTVGQETGGTYTTGSSSQTLDNSSYYWEVKTFDEFSAGSSFEVANSGDVAFIVDSAAPTVTEGPTVEVNDHDATISWSTNEAASTQVEYGLSTNYGYFTSETDTVTRVTSHTKTISSLAPCVKYTYRIKGSDAVGNVLTGSGHTFTTTGCTGEATVLVSDTSDITTAAGGSLSLDDYDSSGSLSLTIPSAFAASNANFQVKQLTANSVIATTAFPLGYYLMGDKMYNLQALTTLTSSITSFDNPITVSMVYSEDDLVNDNPSSAKIFRWDGLSWNELDDCSVNTGTRTITCTTTAFSDFGAFEEEIPPEISFSIEGINDHTVTNGITTSESSTYNTLPFGNLVVNTPKYVAHKLSVTTNASSGYTVSLKLENILQGNNPLNKIDPFAADGVTWETPQTWASPNGEVKNTNTAWFGANTSDIRVTGWDSASGKFGPVSTISHNVMYSSTVDTGTSAYVTYAIEASILQPADLYAGTVVYNILPTY